MRAIGKYVTAGVAALSLCAPAMADAPYFAPRMAVIVQQGQAFSHDVTPVDPDGDYMNVTATGLPPGMSLVQTWQESDFTPTLIGDSFDIETDRIGNFLVSDYSSGQIYLYNGSGNLVTIFGQLNPATGPAIFADGPSHSARFWRPREIAVTPNLARGFYVEDSSGIRLVQGDGQGNWTVSTVRGGGYVQPIEIDRYAIDAYHLFVTPAPRTYIRTHDGGSSYAVSPEQIIAGGGGLNVDGAAGTTMLTPVTAMCQDFDNALNPESDVYFFEESGKLRKISGQRNSLSTTSFTGNATVTTIATLPSVYNYSAIIPRHEMQCPGGGVVGFSDGRTIRYFLNPSGFSVTRYKDSDIHDFSVIPGSKDILVVKLGTNSSGQFGRKIVRVGAPQWAVTGTYSGPPCTGGDYTVMITATDQNGETAQTSLGLTIEPQGPGCSGPPSGPSGGAPAGRPIGGNVIINGPPTPTGTVTPVLPQSPPPPVQSPSGKSKPKPGAIPSREAPKKGVTPSAGP